MPYCTGDVHLGNITHSFDLADRHFQGHNNLRLMAERAHATWPTPSHLVVTGESAGGFVSTLTDLSHNCLYASVNECHIT